MNKLRQIIQLSENQFIDLANIYLVDYENYSNEVLIYINQHPKIPILIKGDDLINSFKEKYNRFINSKDPLHESNQSERRDAENVTKTSEVVLE